MMFKKQKNREKEYEQIWGKSCFKCQSTEKPIIIEKRDNTNRIEKVIMCPECHFAIMYLIVDYDFNINTEKKYPSRMDIPAANNFSH